MRLASSVVAAVALLCGCYRNPPPSQFPTGDAALDRMHETFSCSRGIQSDGKVDYFGDEGRLRGNVLFIVMRPEQLRFDVFSPFGITLSTLTSDGEAFALFDLKNKQFLHGPASQCNVARFTGVPVPPHVLVQLLTGEAPVLKHEPGGAAIAWEKGRYVVRIASRHGAEQKISLEPHPKDWSKPWAEQRVRVTEVEVVQHGYRHYRAELTDHRTASRAVVDEDEDDFDAPPPPSGPECSAEIPRRMRIEMPEVGRDVIFRHDKVFHNPPLDVETFRQNIPGGVEVRRSECRAVPAR